MFKFKKLIWRWRERRLFKRYELAVSHMQPKDREMVLADRVDDVPYKDLPAHCGMTLEEVQEAMERCMEMLHIYVRDKDLIHHHSRKEEAYQISKWRAGSGDSDRP